MTMLRGLKYATFLSIFVGGIALVIYPIVVDPMINTEKYRKMQKHTRAGIDQEAIQPGNMKVWSDPFDRK